MAKRGWNWIKRSASNLGSRGKMAVFLRDIRKKDRLAFRHRRGTYAVSRGLDYYSKFFEVDFEAIVEKTVKAKGTARVLDIGAGEGIFLRNLKSKFFGSVETVATGLSRPPSKRGIDSYRITRIARGKKPLKGKFDLIVSASGETQVMTPKQIVDDVLSLLAPEGRAFLDTGILRFDSAGKIDVIEKQVTGFFEKSGFKVLKVLQRRASEGGTITAMEITRA